MNPEAVQLANQSRYGLSASIWTSDTAKAHRVARDVEVGVVWINNWLVRDLRTPFGGHKASGLGREGGWESMRFFTEAKNVYVDYGEPRWLARCENLYEPIRWTEFVASTQGRGAVSSRKTGWQPPVPVRCRTTRCELRRYPRRDAG